MHWDLFWHYSIGELIRKKPFEVWFVTKIILQVYLDLSAIGMILLGGALACYGEQLLFYFSILSFSRFNIMQWKFPFPNKNSFYDNVRWIYTLKGPVHSLVRVKLLMPSELRCVSFMSTVFIIMCCIFLTGILLCLKMSKVRAEKPSSEMWKVLHFCFHSSIWQCLAFVIWNLFQGHARLTRGCHHLI